MKISMNQVLLDVSGRVIPGDGGRPATLGAACTKALNLDYPMENPAPTGGEKYRRYQLAQEMAACENAGVECEISVEDAALIKKITGIAYAPGVMGAIWDALEGRPQRSMRVQVASAPAPAPPPAEAGSEIAQQAAPAEPVASTSEE